MGTTKGGLRGEQGIDVHHNLSGQRSSSRPKPPMKQRPMHSDAAVWRILTRTLAGESVRALRPGQAPETKAGVVPFRGCRGHCVPLWAVFQPLQVVLSFACSVASLSRFPSHYLPCQLRLPEAATADYLFDKGQPIHAAYRTFNSPWHFHNHTPL